MFSPFVSFVGTLSPLSLTAGSVFPQEPIPTPTPAWLSSVTLQPGVELLIERRISYGDISVVVALIALAMIILFVFFMVLPKYWRAK